MRLEKVQSQLNAFALIYVTFAKSFAKMSKVLEHSSLEDGEIVSDSDEPDSSKDRADAIDPYTTVDRMTIGSQFRTVRQANHDSDNSDGDSDEDCPPIKKKPMTRSHPPCPSGTPNVQDSRWLQNAHRDIQNGKLRNNIWGSVLQEESLSSSVNQLNRSAHVDYSSATGRGVESYDWMSTKDGRDVTDYGDCNVNEEHDDDSSLATTSEESNQGHPHLVQMETFGAPKNQTKLSVKDRLGKKRRERKRHSTDSNKSNKSNDFHTFSDEDIDDNGYSDERKTDIKKSLDTDKRVNDFKRTSRKRKHDKHENKKGKWFLPGDMNVDLLPMKMGVEVNDLMDIALLASTIADAVREPPEKLEVLMNVVEVLGVDKTIKLFKATEDVEEMGGLMIQNGRRRRTPGGVFFFLLRNDTEVTEEQRNRIFKDENEKRKEVLKEHWKQLREKKRAIKSQKKAENAKEQNNEQEHSETLMQEGTKPEKVSERNKKETETAMQDDDDCLDLTEPYVEIELLN